MFGIFRPGVAVDQGYPICIIMIVGCDSLVINVESNEAVCALEKQHLPETYSI